MKAQLVCRPKPRRSLAFELAVGESVLGREPGLAVTLPLAGVSRRHARVVHDGKSWWLEDLKSTNGTFLNGEQVSRERLRHLDVITLGRSADLVFLLREAESGPLRRQGIVAAALVPEESDAAPIAIALGETTLGRAEVCNVMIDNGAVSKVHARILRTAEQLSIEDLGSANGTFVNRSRITTAVLGDGDELSLGGVERFHLKLERGEVEVAAPGPPGPVTLARAERPAFSQEWKTRFEWNEEEQAEIAAFQKELREREAGRAAAPGPAVAGQAHKPASAARPTPDKPAAGKPAPGQPAADRPAAAKPAPAAARPEPAPAVPAAPAPKPAPPTAAAPARPAAPPGSPAPPQPAPRPEATPEPEVAPAPSPEPPKPAVLVPAREADDDALEATVVSGRAPATAPLREVRLTGAGFDVVVTEPGPHPLGRATGAPLRIDHPTVSRRHAQVLLSDDRQTAWVQDVGGTNGTRLNGALITGLTVLHDGDRVGVGEVELTVALKRR